MSERRLIAIDAETVERLRNLEQRAQEQIAYFIDRGQPYEASGYMKDADSLRNILAAWEEGERSAPQLEQRINRLERVVLELVEGRDAHD